MCNRGVYLLPAIVLVGFLLSCTASVKLTAYPGENVQYHSEEECDSGYGTVTVLDGLPSDREYEKLGYIETVQSSNTIYISTSDKKHFKKARKKACQWGADAIVVRGIERKKGHKYVFMLGNQYKDEIKLRIVAIRFKKQ